MLEVQSMSKANESSASATISCGDETGPQLVADVRPIVDAFNACERLWAAARDADEKLVRLCLDCKAEVNWVNNCEIFGQNVGKEEMLTYRGWKMASQALHVAVLYAADLTGDHEQDEQAKAIPVVEILLSHRADVNAFAERVYFDKEANAFMCRRVQAIHMAAGAGNANVVKVLLAHHADIGAEAIVRNLEVVDGSGMVLFRPIHDAVLYNRAECVRLLLKEKAVVNVVNIDGDTPLHMAANFGFANIVELLLGMRKARTAFEKVVDERSERSLKAPKPTRWTGDGFVQLVDLAVNAEVIPKELSAERRELLLVRNLRGMTALELAARGCQFPVQDLYWFVTCQFSIEFKTEEEVLVALDVFASVAVAFPEVARDLLRIADAMGNSTSVSVVDPQNLCRIRQALTGNDSYIQMKVFKMFDNLSDTYPHAAVVLLDALTTTPEENHPVRDPLPRRFVPPRSDLYPLNCVYQPDHKWELDRADEVQAWHSELGGDIRDPVPITVHVVKLQGLACPSVLSKLARQTEDCLFTKLAVHALLKHSWDSMKYLFILDMVYEGIATIVISRWIVTSSDNSIFASQFVAEFMVRMAWCIVAGQASIEAIILLLTGINHELRLSHRDTAEWALRNVHRICLSGMTIGLAYACQQEHWPSEDAVLSGALGAASFGHWLTMMYKMRAFVLTGTRLLPILQAILPIRGMLVILGFLMIGFIHVFWAIDRTHSDGVGTWQFMTFLFIGDNFINTEKLAELSEGRQYLLMLLGGFSLFIFTSCSLNLFIAVLGELYEQEQERLIATFLRERARICSFLILRPELPLSLPSSASGWKWSLGIFLACATSVTLVVGGCTLLRINSWPGALLFALWAVLQQALMKHEMTQGWDNKYIWYCANLAGVEEILSLGHAQQDQMLPQNRAWKLKRYITEIMSKMQKQNEIQKVDLERMENALSKMQTQNETHEADLKRLENAQKALETMLSQALSTIKSVDAKLGGPSAASTVHIELSEDQTATAVPAPESPREETSALQDVAATLIGLSAEAAPTPVAPAQAHRRKRGPKSGAGQRSTTRASAEQLAVEPASGG